MVRRDVSTIVKKLHKKYGKKYLPDDPICLVHQYSDAADQEVVALITALLAFGNAKAVQNSLKKILNFLGPHPYSTLLKFDSKNRLSNSCGHRWIRSQDIQQLFLTLKKTLGDWGSVKNLFLEGHNTKDPDISNALHLFSTKMNQGVKLNFLFPSPQNGSACKRLCLFLRWMIRPSDGIDLGLWPEIPPSKLIVPLDTHICRFALKYRLSRHKTPNWKMACEVTQFLKMLDPQDPLKYDFAICHHGMEKKSFDFEDAM